MSAYEFADGDVVIFEDERGQRQTAIRRGYGFAQWVVATWGFRSMTDQQVSEMLAAGAAEVFPDFGGRPAPRRGGAGRHT